jgi:hypothetical protein
MMKTYKKAGNQQVTGKRVGGRFYIYKVLEFLNLNQRPSGEAGKDKIDELSVMS